MLTDVSQLRSLLGGLFNSTEFLPNMTKRLRPDSDLLQQDIRYSSTPEMERISRELLRKLCEPHVSTYINGRHSTMRLWQGSYRAGSVISADSTSRHRR